MLLKHTRENLLEKPLKRSFDCKPNKIHCEIQIFVKITYINDIINAYLYKKNCCIVVIVLEKII